MIWLKSCLFGVKHSLMSFGFYRRGYLKNRKPQGPDPTKQDKE
jgi:hypothetical protein